MTKEKHPHQLSVSETKEHTSSNIHIHLGSLDTVSEIDNDQLAYSNMAIKQKKINVVNAPAISFFPPKATYFSYTISLTY